MPVEQTVLQKVAAWKLTFTKKKSPELISYPEHKYFKPTINRFFFFLWMHMVLNI